MILKEILECSVLYNSRIFRKLNFCLSKKFKLFFQF